jgi:glycogen debranching enzyme
MERPADEIIELKGQFYIRASSSRVDTRTLVLKQGDTFAVLDRAGDIHPVRAREEGVFHEGTRFLSRYDLRIGKERPLLLNSGVKRDSALFTADLTNGDMDLDAGRLRRGDLYLLRTKFLWHGALHERLRVTSFRDDPLRVPLGIEYAADFADLFEVRGEKRAQRGVALEPQIEDSRIVLGYRGLDQMERRTILTFEPAPRQLDAYSAQFDLALD